MKKLIIGVLFSTILIAACNAQNLYSENNLSQVSSDSLEILYKKVKELRSAGLYLSLVGTGASISGIFIIGGGVFESNEQVYTGVVVFFAGCAMILTGIPIIIIGSSRVKRVKAEYLARDIPLTLEISPSIIQTPHLKQVSAGVSFTIFF